MITDLLTEVVLELLRILFIEDICQRVKARIVRTLFGGRARGRERLLHLLYVRHRERLLHKITTGWDQEL